LWGIMKKSYCCEKLEKTLHFLPDQIKFCCSCTEGLGIKIENFSKIDKGKIISQKEKYIQQLKKGIIPKQCIGCSEIKQIEVNKENFFEKFFKRKKSELVSHIIVDHFKQCDCACIYCAQKILYQDITQKYELLPLIKQLYNQKVLSLDGLVVEFQGGNISMLKEFDDLLKEFNSSGCNDFIFLMNGIKYLPIFETVSLSDNSYACISFDSGTRETFKKIKQVDAFDQIVENIKKIEEKTNLRFSFKYIFIKGLNDNVEEIEKFITLVKSFKRVNNIVFEIDYRDTFMFADQENKVPIYYKELFDYAEKLSCDNGITFIVNDYTKNLLSRLSND